MITNVLPHFFHGTQCIYIHIVYPEITQNLYISSETDEIWIDKESTVQSLHILGVCILNKTKRSDSTKILCVKYNAWHCKITNQC